MISSSFSGASTSLNTDRYLCGCMIFKISFPEYPNKIFILDYRKRTWKNSENHLLASPALRSFNPFHYVCRSEDGREHAVLIENFDEESRLFTLRINGRRVRLQVQDDLDELAERTGARKSSARRAQVLRSPMPGLVVNVFAQPGAAVRKGEVLLVLEAMKMENAIKAPSDAVVGEVLCEPGQSVEKGSALVRFRE